MLYTGKGDTGTTQVYGCNQRISKSSATAEALGAMDEINSFLGLAKVKAGQSNITGARDLALLVDSIQQHLFTIQAELAGFPMKTESKKVKEIEEVIATFEKELPPIKTFFVSGGTELAALFDTARTIARRAERRVVAVHEEKVQTVSPETLAYLNRLSSVLYALARIANHRAGITESVPSYQ